ncbi:heme-binding protein [Streptomyces sp. B5E4]|uniref:GlcG/HbpS family heme-binding protein n=1 Tax=Streptomyces sp. B5E4 TaxID=3153568 RepID=UPI00325E4295
MKKLSIRARVLTGAAAAAVVGGSVLGAAATATAEPAAAPAAAAPATGGVAGEDLTTTRHLTDDAALEAAQAALKAAEKDGRRVTVAVVDRNGNTLVTVRGDGAGPQSYESAERKAYTAVSWNAPTSDLVERLDDAPNLKDIPGTLFLAGGAPVQANDTPIAGIGVAGAPSGAQDEAYAEAGVAALGR